jgi:hypothetical protein
MDDDTPVKEVENQDDENVETISASEKQEDNVEDNRLDAKLKSNTDDETNSNEK